MALSVVFVDVYVDFSSLHPCIDSMDEIGSMASSQLGQSKLLQSYMPTTLALETWAIYQVICSTS